MTWLKMVKISIVIPTLNEECYLPKLLDSISKQTFRDYEIIIADADSKDCTVSIAKRYGAIITKGGIPSVGRNNGAKLASGDFIFFFDADIQIPKDFLKNAYNEMQKKYLDIATCEFKPMSNLITDKVLHDFANLFIKLTQLSDPHAPGFCILVTKRLFDRVGGFNEQLKLAEDHDFVKRASKLEQFRVLNSTYVYVSIRRIRKEGRLAFTKKCIISELHRIFKGEIYNEIFTYEFSSFNKVKKSAMERKLMNLDARLIALNKKYNHIVKEDINNKYLVRVNALKNKLNEYAASFKEAVRSKK